jgi:transcription termination/antitermination protein NusA
MNARLAHRLTGWKIDIVSDTEFAQQEAEAAFAGEEGEDGDVSGRCGAILSNGKRCPNAALPGSRYCGVPAHQELALAEPDHEANPIVQEPEPELEALADTAEPEAVTEDAAEFGDPEPEEFPAGPGDAPVEGEDETPLSGTDHPLGYVEDDPDGGIPIEHVPRREEGESSGNE